ncbi:MAG: hypothetical protein ACI8W8_001664 [Rhodothermales bacterium]|jgi:hypothetical protein
MQANDLVAGEPASDFADDGTDLTLIHWMLSLSVNERLQILEDHAAAAQELRDAFTQTVQLP